MPYVGGKSQAGVYQRIINLIPPHRVYIEPFLGSGAIMRLKKPAEVSIGIELAKAVNCEACETIPGAVVLRGDGMAFLEKYPFLGDEFVYCDPPYLMETRRCQRGYYAFEMSREDHVRLLDLIKTIPGKVMISGYPSRLYDEALLPWPFSWRKQTFEVETRAHTKATEVLWFNYDPPARLHDTRFVGEDFRERWRIEKRRRRWRARLEKMNPLERDALFVALTEVMARDPRAVSGAAGS